MIEYIKNAYDIVDKMSVSGANQELAVMAKQELRKAYEEAKNDSSRNKSEPNAE